MLKIPPTITSIYYVNLHNNTLQIPPNITSIYYVNLHHHTLQITPNITLYIMLIYIIIGLKQHQI